MPPHTATPPPPAAGTRHHQQPKFHKSKTKQPLQKLGLSSLPQTFSGTPPEQLRSNFPQDSRPSQHGRSRASQHGSKSVVVGGGWRWRRQMEMPSKKAQLKSVCVNLQVFLLGIDRVYILVFFLISTKNLTNQICANEF